LYLPWADCRVYFGDTEHRVMTIERAIAPYLKRLSRTARTERLESLFRHNPVDPIPDPQDAFCTTEDLLKLRASPFAELHPHSHYHHPYETLNEEELVDDVTRCRRFFVDSLGIESSVMSYPNGRSRPGHDAILNRLGIKHAFSINFGLEQPPKTLPYGIMRAPLSSEPMASFHWNIRRLLRS
jgi:hypothetical protein